MAWRPYFERLVKGGEGNAPKDVLRDLREYSFSSVHRRGDPTTRFNNFVGRIRRAVTHANRHDAAYGPLLRSLYKRRTNTAAVKRQLKIFDNLSLGEQRDEQKLMKLHAQDPSSGAYRKAFTTGDATVDAELRDLPLAPFLETVKVSKDDLARLKRIKERALQAKTSNVMVLPTSLVDSLVHACRSTLRRAALVLRTAETTTRADLMKTASALKVDMKIVLCMLALATGRRGAELFYSGSFEAVEGNPYMACFQGQLKKKYEAQPCYFIPLLEKVKYVNAALELMRLYYVHGEPVRSPADANRRFGKLMSRAVATSWDRGAQKHRPGAKRGPSFQDLRSTFKFHDLRQFYGIFTFHLCRLRTPGAAAASALAPLPYALPAWLSMILGHNTFDLATSAHYSALSFDGPPLQTRPIPFDDLERRRQEELLARELRAQKPRPIRNRADLEVTLRSLSSGDDDVDDDDNADDNEENDRR